MAGDLEMLGSPVSSHFNVIQSGFELPLRAFLPPDIVWKAILVTSKTGSEQPAEQHSSSV